MCCAAAIHAPYLYLPTLTNLVNGTHQAPWSVKEQLEAAGVRGLRAATPVVLRPLLRRLGERQPGANAEGGQHQPFRGEGMTSLGLRYMTCICQIPIHYELTVHHQVCWSGSSLLYYALGVRHKGVG